MDILWFIGLFSYAVGFCFLGLSLYEENNLLFKFFYLVIAVTIYVLIIFVVKEELKESSRLKKLQKNLDYVKNESKFHYWIYETSNEQLWLQAQEYYIHGENKITVKAIDIPKLLNQVRFPHMAGELTTRLLACIPKKLFGDTPYRIGCNGLSLFAENKAVDAAVISSFIVGVQINDRAFSECLKKFAQEYIFSKK